MADLSDERLAEILAGCEGVTPGPWQRRDATTLEHSAGTLLHTSTNNLAHIARLDPATVASLITELQRRRTAPDRRAMEATHRHKKRGTEYVLLGIGKMQVEKWLEVDPGPKIPWAPGKTTIAGRIEATLVDMREVAVYRSATDPTEIWVRPREDFEDGRFEALIPSDTDQEGEL